MSKEPRRPCVDIEDNDIEIECVSTCCMKKDRINHNGHIEQRYGATREGS